MEVQKVISEMQELAPAFKKVFKDEQVAENLSAWMDGYLQRGELEKRRKEKDDVTD